MSLVDCRQWISLWLLEQRMICLVGILTVRKTTDPSKVLAAKELV